MNAIGGKPRDDSALSELRGQRVLITGGLGFVGSNLAQHCHAHGARVTIYDCLDPRSGGNIHNVREIERDVEILVSDVRNFGDLCAAVRQKDVVFNCAAYTSHPQSMTDPLTDIDVNCKGAIHLLEAARRFNPDVRIVHVGTSTQIGRMRRSPVDEHHPEFPADIYSANKCAAEKYFMVYASAYGLRATVIRLANNFGPRSNIRSADFGFVNFFIGLALRGKDLTVFGTGQQLRNISYIDDSVRALLLAALSNECHGEVLFAVADRQCAVADIAAAICRNIGGNVRFVEWPRDRQAIEIGDAVISNGRIRQILGWQPEISLDDGLARTCTYFRGCLDRYLDVGLAKSA